MSRKLPLAAATCLLASGLIGCTWTKGSQATRTTLSKKEEPEPIVSFAEESNGSANDSAPPKGFFKNTRLPGALSSEAADIERNLGISR